MIRNIVNWSRTAEGVADISAKSTATTFEELGFKIGHPYLYVHDGCSHIIVFDEVRYHFSSLTIDLFESI